MTPSSLSKFRCKFITNAMVYLLNVTVIVNSLVFTSLQGAAFQNSKLLKAVCGQVLQTDYLCCNHCYRACYRGRNSYSDINSVFAWKN